MLFSFLISLLKKGSGRPYKTISGIASIFKNSKKAFQKPSIFLDDREKLKNKEKFWNLYSSASTTFSKLIFADATLEKT